MEDDARRRRIRELNDRLRTTWLGGRVVFSRGVAACSNHERAQVMAAVVRFSDFSPENDPWGEHDCAAVAVNGRRIIWKIDYYDQELRHHSRDPADPGVTIRVLTVMLAAEY